MGGDDFNKTVRPRASRGGVTRRGARRALSVLVAAGALLPLGVAEANETPPAHWAEQPALPVLPEVGAQAAALATYRLPAERFEVTFGAGRDARRFRETPVTFPSAVQERWPTVQATYYRPHGASAEHPVPGAVIVHHLGGSIDAEAYVGKHLATHGVAALFVRLPNYGQRREPETKQGFLRFGPEVAFVGFRQAVLDVIRAADVLRSMPEVDANRVGAVGVSLGAFVTAVARGVDPRLRRTVLVLGGGDLARMFRELPEGAELLAASGIDPASLPALLAPVDPLTFADRVAPADVLMLNARNDEIVPVDAAESLWRALGEPEIRWFNCGHYGVVLHLPRILNLALDHLRGRSAL